MDGYGDVVGVHAAEAGEGRPGDGVDGWVEGAVHWECGFVDGFVSGHTCEYEGMDMSGWIYGWT